MRAVIGIMYQTILGAVRSRLFLSELLLLLAISVAGPIMLNGDGTLAGHVDLTVRYTLAASWMLLGAGILWASGAELASDMASSRLHLVVTKPIGGIRLLLGRWLGLVALHAVLAVLAVAVAAAMVLQTSRGYDAQSRYARPVFLAHRVTYPEPTVTRTEIETAYARAQQTEGFDKDITFEQFAPMLRASLLATRATVNTGHQRTWTFETDDLLDSLAGRRGQHVWLRFRFSASALERVPIQGQWIMDAAQADPIRIPVEGIQDGEHVVAVAPDQMETLLAGLPPDAQLDVSFSNAASSCTIMFDTTKPVEVLVPRSSLGLNMLRGSLIMICTLGALCALGLLCGVLFSGPVAAATSVGILAAITLSVGTGREDWSSAPLPDHPVARRAATISAATLSGVSRAMQPAVRHRAIERIAAGELLTGGTLAAACLPLIGLYSLPLLVLGGLVINRRQLGGI